VRTKNQGSNYVVHWEPSSDYEQTWCFDSIGYESVVLTYKGIYILGDDSPTILYAPTKKIGVKYSKLWTQGVANPDHIQELLAFQEIVSLNRPSKALAPLVFVKEQPQRHSGYLAV
jgi:hypothetical protein